MVGGGIPELQPQPGTGLDPPLRCRVAGRLARRGDAPDAPAPGLYHPGPEERIGDSRIVRYRSVLLGQPLDRPVRRQVRGIPQHDPLVVHPNLNGHRIRIVAMDYRVDHRLAHRVARHRKGLHAIVAVVGNQRPRILGIQQVDGAVDLREQVAFDHVLEQQLGAAEIPDLHVGIAHEASGLRMEQQHGRPLQVLALPQAQLLDHAGVGLVEDVSGEPLAGGRAAAKLLQRATVQVLESDAGQRLVVPLSAILLQQEAIQRRAAQQLAGAATPVVEFTLVADRVGVGIDDDLQVLPARLRFQVHVDHDAEQRLRLVGDLVEQPQHVLHSDHLAPVVSADFQHAALSVGEPAHPLQVLVPPRFLPLDVLILAHEILTVRVSARHSGAPPRVRALGSRGSSRAPHSRGRRWRRPPVSGRTSACALPERAA